jgi:hypothetical protein
MSVLVETFDAFCARYPQAITAWVLFCVLPLVSCFFWTARYYSSLSQPVRAFFRALAHSFGYPTALFGLIFTPIAAFNIFLAPALVEAYPSWRPFLFALLAIPNWVIAQFFWLAPAAWLIWVAVAPRHAIRNLKV